MEWEAKTLVTLGEELRTKITAAKRDLQARVACGEIPDDYEAVQQAEKDFQDAIRQSFSEQVEQVVEAAGGPAHALVYRNELAGVDLDRLAYRGDRDALADLLSRPQFAFSVNQCLAESRPYNSRRELLTRGLKLTRRMAPLVHRVIDRCRDALQLTSPVEIYAYQDPTFNAACYPPVQDKILIMITSAMLEKFSEPEIAQVVGHEIGHYLYEHVRYPPGHILSYANASPLDSMKIYAWIRNAEITADRVGMICSQDFEAVANSFFKLSSGVTGSVLHFELNEYLEQLREIENEVGDDDPETWYSTHPFSPLRLKALDIFVNSQTYHDLVGDGQSGTSDAEADQQLDGLLSIMRPSYLEAGTDVGEQAKRWVLVAGYLMAAANGKIDTSELEALAQMLESNVDSADIEGVASMQLGAVRAEVEALSKSLDHVVEVDEKMQMLQNMAVISYADGSLEHAELECLYWLSEQLNVPPDYVDHVLMSARQGVD